MTKFGADLVPKIYRNRTARQLTQWELVRELIGALKAVGMKPYRHPELTRFREDYEDDDIFDIYSNISSSDYATQFTFVFDFPDDHTVVSNGIPWKPCFIIHMGLHQYRDSTSSNAFSDLALMTGMRRQDTDWYTEDRIREELILNFGRSYYDMNRMWYGGSSYTQNAFSGTQYGGTRINNNQASPGSQAEYWSSKRYPVGNMEVVLGPGGLHVQVGSGFRKSDCNNHLCLSALFGGERIPGRARAPEDDPDIDMTAHVFHTAWDSETATSTWYHFHAGSSSQYRPRGLTFGRQYTNPYTGAQQFSLGLFQADFYNYENINRLGQDDYGRADPSPRKMGNTSYHALIPMVSIIKHTTHNSNDDEYYTTKRQSDQASVPLWEECYYHDSFVFSDGVAPYGIYSDPATADDWFMFRGPHHNTMFGFKVTGYDLLTAADLDFDLGITVQTEEHIDLSSGAPVSDGPTPCSQLYKSSQWNYATGEDRIYYTTSNTVSNYYFTIAADIAADTPGQIYEVAVEVRHRGDAGTEWDANTPDKRSINPVLQIGHQGSTQDYYHIASDANDVHAAPHLTIPCAGADPTNRFYDWREVKFLLSKRAWETILKIAIRSYRPDADQTSGSRTMELRNFRLRRVTVNN
jgi:hypothetical protein